MNGGEKPHSLSMHDRAVVKDVSDGEPRIGGFDISEINVAVMQMVADGSVQPADQEAVTQELQQVRGKELLQIVTTYPKFFSTERLTEVIAQTLEPETNAALFLELLQRGESGVVEQLLGNFSSADQERLSFVVRKLRETGVEFSLPTDDEKAAVTQYNMVDLEDFTLESSDMPESVRLNARERRVVFHGTKQQHITSLQRGLFSVSENYKMVTKSIQAALEYKTGMYLETVSDGTVTIWDPPRDYLGGGDRVAYPIAHPIDAGAIPSDVPKPKNSFQTEHRYGLPAETFCGTIHFSPEQIQQVHAMRSSLSAISSENAPAQLSELIASLQQQLPDKMVVEWSQTHTDAAEIDIKKVISVMLYESELKARAQDCVHPSPAALQRLEAFPTYGVAAYEKYKTAKLTAMTSLKS